MIVHDLRPPIDELIRTCQEQWVLWTPSRPNQTLCFTNPQRHPLFTQMQNHPRRPQTLKHPTKISQQIRRPSHRLWLQLL